jgi:hypothetical protein
MEYMDSMMQSFYDNAELERQYIDDEAKQKARETNLIVKQGDGLKGSENPYDENSWQYREYEQAYDYYLSHSND